MPAADGRRSNPNVQGRRQNTPNQYSWLALGLPGREVHKGYLRLQENAVVCERGARSVVYERIWTVQPELRPPAGAKALRHGFHRAQNEAGPNKHRDVFQLGRHDAETAAGAARIADCEGSGSVQGSQLPDALELVEVVRVFWLRVRRVAE